MIFKIKKCCCSVRSADEFGIRKGKRKKEKCEKGYDGATRIHRGQRDTLAKYCNSGRQSSFMIHFSDICISGPVEGKMYSMMMERFSH